MKNKLILLLTLAITSSLQAISFRDYYRAHEKEVNDAVARGSLDLESKNLTDLEGFDEIPNLTNLQRLWLRNNQLASVPATLGNLKNLQVLDLGGNQLTSIPATLGNLENLESLYLYNNRLTSIPATLGNLTQLQRLSLVNNQLTSIPATLSNLMNLRELWLYNNPIPLNTIQLQTKLHLGPNVELIFKTPKQEEIEYALIKAIKTADEPAVRGAFKDIMTGVVEAPYGQKIDITKIRDSAGNNLLQIVVAALADKIKSINNNESLNEGKKAVARNWAEKAYTKIFFSLAQSPGPAQQMLLTTNKNGDTVLATAIGLLGPNSEFVQAIRQYEHVPTPADEFATQFKTTSRRPVEEETEGKDEKEIQADVIQAMEKIEKEQAAQKPKVLDPAKREAALGVLGLTSAEDNPEVIQQTFRKLAVQYKPSNIPPDAPLDTRTKIIEEYKALENAKNYLLG